MKNLVKCIILFSFSFLNSDSLQACVCGKYFTTPEKINQSDYVALVKIIDIVSMGTRENYKVITEELILYKGNPKNEIVVYGSNRAIDTVYFTSCDMNIRKNQQWLFYASEKNGVVYTGYCNRSFVYKDELGYRALMYANTITQLNEVNKFFNKPIIDFTKKSGLLNVYYPNGQVEINANFRNSLRDGVTRYYYPDGVLQGEEYYKEGKLHGTAKRFFKEGTLDRVSHFQNGIEVDSTNWYEYNKDSGRYYMWHTSFNDKQGRMLFSKTYTIPIKHGPANFIFNSNKFYLRSELIFDTIKKETTYVDYHPNGRIKTFYKLNDTHEYVGDEIEYDDKGYVIKILRVIKGEKNKVIYIDKKIWPDFKNEN